MDIVVIGSGMYVSGRQTDSYGTILPSIIEFQRGNKLISSIKIVGTSAKRANEAKKKYNELSAKTGIKIPISFFPKENDNVYEYRKIIDKLTSPSCIIIAVPDHLHYEIIKYAINKKHHVLVVKPLTPTFQEGKSLVELAKDNNVYGAVEFHKRFDKQNRILRDLYNQNQFGIPLYTWTEYSQRKTIPTKIFNSWVHHNNILQYLGVHYIDIIRFVTKAKPKRVMAIGQKTFLENLGFEIHDSIQCIIEWETTSNNTFSQTLLVNWIDPENTSSMSDQNIKFVGTNGRYEGDQKDRGLITVSDKKQFEHINPDFCKSFQNEQEQQVWEGYGINSIKTFIYDVYEIINQRKKPVDFENIRPTFSEALYATSVLDSALKSLEKNAKWIDVKTI